MTMEVRLAGFVLGYGCARAAFGAGRTQLVVTNSSYRFWLADVGSLTKLATEMEQLVPYLEAARTPAGT